MCTEQYEALSMKTYSAKTYPARRRRQEMPEDIAGALRRFMHSLGKAEHMELAKLWQHWNTVMGEYLEGITWPLGAKDGVLFISAEDAITMQELSYMHDEILDRVNDFMGKMFFHTVKVRLLLDKAPLHEAVQRPGLRRIPVPQGPTLTGEYLSSMDPASPVARCYALFIKKGQTS